MCAIIHKGETEIGTPRQMIDQLPIKKMFCEGGYSFVVDLEACLCQVNIDKTLEEAGINFEKETMDYKIIEL